MRVLLGVFVAVILSAAAAAQERVALLIGNEAYPADVGRLNHPFEDVEVIAAGLRAAGFPAEQVRVVKDASADVMRAEVNAFAARLDAAGEDAVGFFYYSGHGGSFDRQGFRENFLIPAGAEVTIASELPLRGVSLSDIVDTLAATSAGAVFVVSDACRNSLPFTRGGADPDKGFTVEPARPGLFIAHATAPGATAPDDGAFARALAAQLAQPEQFAERAFTLAFREVSRRRDAYRLPTVSSDLREDFCFVSCPSGGAAGGGDMTAAEIAFWSSVENSSDPATIQAYLDTFPNGTFASLANVRLNALRAAEAASAAAAVTPEAKIQQALKDLHLYDGPIDGIIGEGTQAGLNYVLDMSPFPVEMTDPTDILRAVEDVRARFLPFTQMSAQNLRGVVANNCAGRVATPYETYEWRGVTFGEHQRVDFDYVERDTDTNYAERNTQSFYLADLTFPVGRVSDGYVSIDCRPKGANAEPACVTTTAYPSTLPPSSHGFHLGGVFCNHADEVAFALAVLTLMAKGEL